jgi:hypothetical protein
MASSHSALARLTETLGNAGEAVSYRVSALAIRATDEHAAGVDIEALSELRRELGAERFRTALPPNLDEDSATNLMQVLDQRDTSGGD